MPLHFTEQELAARREMVVAELQDKGLAALLIFRQESMYYLTGYDTTGYSQFQCLYLGADGKLVLPPDSPSAAARPTRALIQLRLVSHSHSTRTPASLAVPSPPHNPASFPLSTTHPLLPIPALQASS